MECCCLLYPVVPALLSASLHTTDSATLLARIHNKDNPTGVVERGHRLSTTASLVPKFRCLPDPPSSTLGEKTKRSHGNAHRWCLAS